MRTNTFDFVVENNVLDFLTNIEMSENLPNSSFEKIIGEVLLYVRENVNVMALATCVIDEKTLDVLNTEKCIFVNKIRNSVLKYLYTDHETEAIFKSDSLFHQVTFSWL